MMFGKLAEGSFLRNVVILMFGSGMSQLIPLLFSPVLSRLFTTSEFGVFTVFTTVAAFLGVLATFRYDLAIMLPKKKSDAFHLLALSVFITLIVSFIILIITLLFAKPISRLLNTEELIPWLPFLALSILLLGISQSLNFWHNRNKSYKTLSANMISQSSTTAVVSTANGFAKMDAGGLIIGSLSGQLVSSILYVLKFLKHDKQRLKYISPKRIKNLSNKYIDYPKFSLPHRMVDMISITGIPLLLMMIFTESVVGLYGFMLRVLKAPIGVLAASLGQVFYQQLSEKVSKNQSVKSLFLKTIKNIAFITLPFFVLILIWGPDIFALIF
ncbi:MAG: oligosaccharide flippase family protein, partial [Bacteroidales bacterium]|nr:oligosaccharide flippase family protein [Bacteroidales bacterium]